jgi:hypothetical protein
MWSWTLSLELGLTDGLGHMNRVLLVVAFPPDSLRFAVLGKVAPRQQLFM